MNERQFVNRLPELIDKTLKLMKEKGVPIHPSARKAQVLGREMPIPVTFVEGERADLIFEGDEMPANVIPMDPRGIPAWRLEVGEDLLMEGRLDPVVNAIVHLFQDANPEEKAAFSRLEKEGETRQNHPLEMVAAFIQGVYRFTYNKNTVKGLFFYCRMNDIKNGDRLHEATSLSGKRYHPEHARVFNEICRTTIF
ncbi:MAG: hypothetical protein HQL52_05725 [Magnetococcales bacterium]|nr:hypothetical protein [Magnetococcales bacterium]